MNTVFILATLTYQSLWIHAVVFFALLALKDRIGVLANSITDVSAMDRYVI